MLSLFSTLVCVVAQLTISASRTMALLVLNKIRICFMLCIACLVEVVWEVVLSGWESVEAPICPRDFFGRLEERLTWSRIGIVVLPRPREYPNGGKWKSNNLYDYPEA
jgi:hypothetical protein